jgi:ATP-binding cassette subfamily F protein 3
MLGGFLFRGDDIDKKVKVLSGGERSRLALIKLLLDPHNLLVLDEPTNHLDMRSKDILKQALVSYDGTLIVVSHDRDFLDGLITKVYEFRHKHIKENIGGIYDFIRKRKIENLRDIEKKEKPDKADGRVNNSIRKQEYLEKKEFERELRKLKKKLETTEHNIESIEADLIEMDKLLRDPPDPGFDQDLYNKYEETRQHLNEEMSKWAGYSHDIELFLRDNN